MMSSGVLDGVGSAKIPMKMVRSASVRALRSFLAIA
jgi:hypothetical protein